MIQTKKLHYGYFRIFISLILTCFFALGCASFDTNRKKAFATLAVGVAAGAVLGQASAPSRNSRSGWTVLGGAAGGLAAGIANAFYFDGSKEIENAKQENLELVKLLEAEKLKSAPKLIEQGSSLLGKNLATELPIMIKPGGWKKYKLDRWVKDTESENIFFRQTEMIELILPVIQ